MARIGDYELIDHFATGGVAEIYRARDVRDGKVVVIKRMRQDVDFDPEHQAGFLRELQVALSATHKNLIRGFAKGSVNGADYGVLEYIDGPDLARVLAAATKARVQIPPTFATYVALELLAGIEFAFGMKGPDGKELGLVHRDLSPKNVFLRSDGEVRIGDFGSSLASKVERVDDIVGSPGYMSPEQASKEQLDQRSDLFAIGLILFEMLAGAPAFPLSGKGVTDGQLLKMHQRAELRPLLIDVPEDLRMVVEIATARDREDRFQSPRAMRHAILRTEQAPQPTTQIELAALMRSLMGAELAKARVEGAVRT